jgi:hypothetical protein
VEVPIFSTVLTAPAVVPVGKGRVAFSPMGSPLATRPLNQHENQGLNALYGETNKKAILEECYMNIT